MSYYNIDNIKYLDVKQVSHILGVDKTKTYNLCYSGKLEFKKIHDASGINKNFITKESLEDYLGKSLNLKEEPQAIEDKVSEQSVNHSVLAVQSD